jgi:type I restriction enzyme S subunit
MKNNSWSKIPLLDLASIWIGGTPSRGKPEYWDESRQSKNVWVSIRDLSELKDIYISDSSEYITDEGVRRSNVKLIPQNTVLMSFKLSIGKVAISKIPLYTNEAIASFHIKDTGKLNPFYLYYVLPTLNFDTDTAIKGKTLNKSKLNSTLVPVPQIHVQEKIADVLVSIDKTIQKNNQIIKASEILKKGMTNTLLSKGIGHKQFKKTTIGMIPMSWEVVSLNDVIKIANGQVDPREEKYSKMILIAPNHIESNTGRIIEKVSAYEQQAISGKYLVEKGDVIYSKIRPYLKKVAVAQEASLVNSSLRMSTIGLEEQVSLKLTGMNWEPTCLPCHQHKNRKK